MDDIFSQAVRVGDLIYLSGSIGMHPESKALPEVVEDQTHQALKNIGEILKEAGVGFENVVKTTVLLKSISDWPSVNNVYKEYFVEGKYPARTAYEVANLPLNALVEIESIAIVPSKQ
ncbi:hypothetical protein PRIPAC_97913 [Pristionchus pacificus]|uniref:Uncharacterized protein n=1 Tax=Pristionchus pacificus TaxID=54126 RepID=A0A2A6D2H6_PRIPA|nr:hypothetical protein PRIPAC_97913 [Pristionchus pacificus]|eukprot:PDM84599.1 hypothetical protein PRIPAC_33622 [Pristionchus pacificus]